MLGTLAFTESKRWALFNFPKNTALQYILAVNNFQGTFVTKSISATSIQDHRC